jgi:hypothetical protein
MSDTPRTDAAQTIWNDIGMMVVLSSFARQLERELAELTEALAEKDQLAIDMRNQRNRAITARDAERALADRLAGELQWWGDYCGDNAPASIDLTLAAWKEARRGTN